MGLDRFCLFLSLVANVSGVVEGESSSVPIAGGDASRILDARERTRLIICGSPDMARFTDNLEALMRIKYHTLVAAY